MDDGYLETMMRLGIWDFWMMTDVTCCDTFGRSVVTESDMTCHTQ